jgi:hypothetical protein
MATHPLSRLPTIVHRLMSFIIFCMRCVMFGFSGNSINGKKGDRPICLFKTIIIAAATRLFFTGVRIPSGVSARCPPRSPKVATQKLHGERKKGCGASVPVTGQQPNFASFAQNCRCHFPGGIAVTRSRSALQLTASHRNARFLSGESPDFRWVHPSVSC